MQAFDKAWAATHAAEKGYSNNPDDSGGETNHGITVAVARKLGYTGRMIDLTKEAAREMAKKEYWDTLELDYIAEISERIALEVFDTGFNCGQSMAATFLQEGLNCFNRSNRSPPDYPEVAEDGRIGNRTLSALRQYLDRRGKDGELVMLRFLNATQGAYYNSLRRLRVKDEEFTFGWFLNRVTI